MIHPIFLKPTPRLSAPEPHKLWPIHGQIVGAAGSKREIRASSGYESQVKESLEDEVSNSFSSHPFRSMPSSNRKFKCTTTICQQKRLPALANPAIVDGQSSSHQTVVNYAIWDVEMGRIGRAVGELVVQLTYEQTQRANSDDLALCSAQIL